MEDERWKMEDGKRAEVDLLAVVLSAVALRRQFLEKQAAAATAAKDGMNGADNEDNRPIEKARKSIPDVASPLKTPQKALTKDTAIPKVPELMYVSIPTMLCFRLLTQISPAAPEPVERLRKEKVVQLSSFKQTKSNHQRKSDGTFLLKLPEREVCLPLPQPLHAE